MVCVRSSRRRFYNQSSIDSPRVEKRDLVTSHDRPGCDGQPRHNAAPAPPKPRSGEGGCPPAGWSLTRLDALKRDGFKMPDTFQRHELAIALTGCLGDPKPEIRDGIAFEALSTWMRAGQLDLATMQTLRGDLLKMMARQDAEGFGSAFAALVLSEVARTDRLRAWMSAEERDELVRAGALYLARVKDYRAFSDAEGFRHAVAHGADFAAAARAQPADHEGATRSHDARRGHAGGARTRTLRIGQASRIAWRGRSCSSRNESCIPRPSGKRSSPRSPIRNRSRRGRSHSPRSLASRSAITSAPFS